MTLFNDYPLRQWHPTLNATFQTYRAPSLYTLLGTVEVEAVAVNHAGYMFIDQVL